MMLMKKMSALLVLTLLLSQTSVNAQPASIDCAHRLIVEPDDGRTTLLKVLDNAKESISLTIYEIDDPEVNAALIRAVTRGVKVRILYNYYSFCSMGREYKLEPALNAFETAGILLCRAPQEFTIGIVSWASSCLRWKSWIASMPPSKKIGQGTKEFYMNSRGGP